MTLADILKPSLTILSHAELRGLRIGAAAGALVSLPCILKPGLLNPANEQPINALTHLVGLGAALGASAITLTCAYRLSQETDERIVTRAEKLLANREERRVTAASLLGAGAGVALVVGRVVRVARSEGRCVFGLTFRKETAWEMFAFGALGAAVGAGLFVVGKNVCDRIETRESDGVREVDEGDAAELVKDAVEEIKDAAAETE